MAKEALRRITGRVAGEIVLDAFPKQVAYRENLEAAREYLESGGAIISISNHFAVGDFAHWFNVDRKIAQSRKWRNRGKLDHVGAVGAQKRLDTDRGFGGRVQKALADLWHDGSGITLIPMVQSGDIGSYPDWRKRMKAGVDAIVDFLNPGNIMHITLEGTKIRTGGLGKGNTGIEHILKDAIKKGKDFRILPMAAIPRTIFPGSDTLVIVGELVSYQQLLEEEKATGIRIADLLMLRIADLLPERNQGVYREMLAAHPELRHHPELASVEVLSATFPYESTKKVISFARRRLSHKKAA